MTRPPEGYEVDHFAPDAFLLCCPDCGLRWKFRNRPGKEGRTCLDCDRLMGVTPIARTETDDSPESTDTGEGVRADGGTATVGPDPLAVPPSASPAVVKLLEERGGPSYLLGAANVDLRETGGLTVLLWNGRTVMLPAWRWREVYALATRASEGVRQVDPNDWHLLPDEVHEQVTERVR